MSNTEKMLPEAQRAYVTLMMGVVGRGLVSTSQIDTEIRRELAHFPVGYTIQMTVMPSGPSFTVESLGDGSLRLCSNFEGRADLCIRFKHMSHAFLVFSFQEATARAFANDRMYVDGDVSHAIRMVRCLNRMEVLILPKFIAERAVKRYPAISIGEKLNLAVRIYGRLALNFAKGE